MLLEALSIFWLGFAISVDVPLLALVPPLLAGAGLTLPDRFDGPADHVAPDDLLDAAVAAWSAARVARGAARSFPDASDDRDACGRTIQIRA